MSFLFFLNITPKNCAIIHEFLKRCTHFFFIYFNCFWVFFFEGFVSIHVWSLEKS